MSENQITVIEGQEKVKDEDLQEVRLFHNQPKDLDKGKKTLFGKPVHYNSVLHDENLKKFYDIMCRSNNRTKAAEAVGISTRTINNLEDRYPEFKAMMLQAFQAYKDMRVERVEKGLKQKPNVKNDMRWLQMRFPDEFGTKRSKVEHTHRKQALIRVPIVDAEYEVMEEKTVHDDIADFDKRQEDESE